MRVLALDPDPGQARDLLARELARSRYQESLVERFERWFSGLLGRLDEATGASGPWGVALGVLVVVVLAVLLAVALSRLRPAGGRDRAAVEVFAERRRTAADHRGAAEAALADGRPDDAVLEAVRALTAGLVERDLLRDSAGLTVLETVTAATGSFPDEAGALDRLRVSFEETRYGQRRADAGAAREVLDTEQRVRQASPRRRTGVPDSPVVPS